jgi:iron-sulfur cluster repair protein YtfE (RIC family)
VSTQPNPPAAAAETVTSHVRREHSALHGLLRDVCDDVEAGRGGAARAACEAFERRLLGHFRIEEAVLFPLFEARVGIVGGPTATLRQEHRDLARSVGLMRESLERDDAEAFQDSLRMLRTILRQHCSKEERVLFPTTDAALSETELAAACERLRRLRA